MGKVKLEFPEKLNFLFLPSRYKVAHGGRGSAKSWSYARALLVIARKRKVRILCAREVQKTIQDSVHKLLKDQIELMGFGRDFTVYESEILGNNGSEFAFTGLAHQTVHSIKSFEGYDFCWVEEGQAVRKRSWDILIPTIRKDNSEIWVTFNPDLETDDTYQRFVVNTPPNTYIVEMNWRDNPWFNDILDAERLHCLATDPDSYDNIWEGKCRPAVEGAIYFKEIQRAQNEGRICPVPYDPMLRVHVVFDLGFNDFNFINLVQRHLSQIRIIGCIADDRRTLDDYSVELREKRYNWGEVWLPPSDGFAKDIKTGKGCDQIMKALGWDVVKRKNLIEATVEEGIRQTRMAFPQMYFDAENTKPLIESCKRYRRKINTMTGGEGAPVHDEYCHGADCLRYTALNAPLMKNASGRKRPKVVAPSYGVLDDIVGY